MHVLVCVPPPQDALQALQSLHPPGCLVGGVGGVGGRLSLRPSAPFTCTIVRLVFPINLLSLEHDAKTVMAPTREIVRTTVAWALFL